MTANQPTASAMIIPALRYRDARAAIDWLCRAFGFAEHLIVPGEGDAIAHAQLTYGNSMIMLGSGQAGEYDRLIRQPSEARRRHPGPLRHCPGNRCPLRAGQGGGGRDRRRHCRSGSWRALVRLS